MTAARHRSATAVAERPGGPGLKGKAPGGMWWVAWRQHRLQTAVVLALVAALAVAMIIFRALVIARFTAAGCDLTATQCTGPNGNDLWYGGGSGFSLWSRLLQFAILLAPIVLGVFAGASVFAREFAHGSHVFALTQSVSRLRWWAVKLIVAGVPLIVGLLVLGFVREWVDDAVGYTADQGLEVTNFAVHSIIPAAHGLVAFAIAVAAAILTRSTVTSLVSGLIVAGLAVVGMVLIQPHVLPATRSVTPFDTQNLYSPLSVSDGDRNFQVIDSGYLNAAGESVPADLLMPCYPLATDAADKAFGIKNNSASAGSGGAVEAAPAQTQDSPEYEAAVNRALVECAHGKGIVAQFTDYLPGSLLWPLRGAMTGIAAALAALFLLLGAAWLRAAVAKR